MTVASKLKFLNLLIIRAIIIIFKLLGLAPFLIKIKNLTHDKNNYDIKASVSLRGFAYNFLLIIYFIYSTSIDLLSIGDNSITHLNKFVREFIIIFRSVSIIVTLIIYNLKQKSAVKIINDFLLIENFFFTKLNYKKSIKKYLLSFIVIIQLLIIIAVVILELIKGNFKLQLIVIKNLITTIIIDLSLIQYIIVLFVICSKLSSLNELFSRLKKSNNEYESNLFMIIMNSDENDFKRIKNLEKGHVCVYKVLIRVGKFYSRSILLVLIYYCIVIIYGFYLFIISSFLGEKSEIFTVDNSYCFFFMLEHLYPIIVLTTCVTIIDKQVGIYTERKLW